MELLWFYNREGVYRDGTIDEKVTVISSVVHTYIRTYQAKLEVGNGISANFYVTEAGNTVAALGNIHEDDGHILKYIRSKVNHIVTVILFDNSMT